MNYPLRSLLLSLLLSAAAFCAASAQTDGKQVATIRKVSLLPATDSLELEIMGSGRLSPQAQTVTDPDRLVIDIPGAVPASTLHNFTVSRGAVKAVRVGLFSDNPPTTRIVLDLASAQQYQVFPSGNTVIIKMSGGGARRPAVKNAGFTTEFEVVETPTITPPPAPPKVVVTFINGDLTILANKATLSEVLFEVQKKTGADIGIPAGAEREQVAANFGPGPARQILSSLLNGSNFNFIMIADDNDPSKLRSVILSPKGAPMAQPQGPTAPH